MPESRSISFHFCDDIRREIGNKFSLIGCYGSAMYVHPLPTVLPKLCAEVRAYTPIDRPFEKLVVRILRDEEILAETVVPNDALGLPKSLAPPWATRQVLTTLTVMSPFPVEGPCRLRVEAETEEGTIIGGSFAIQEPDPKQGTTGIE